MYVPNLAFSRSSSTGTSLLIVVNVKALSATSLLDSRDFFALGGDTSSILSYIPFIEPYLVSRLIAVFIPIPGIPGTLSDESPCNAFICATYCGPSPPYLFSTSTTLYREVRLVEEFISTQTDRV